MVATAVAMKPDVHVMIPPAHRHLSLLSAFAKALAWARVGKGKYAEIENKFDTDVIQSVPLGSGPTPSSSNVFLGCSVSCVSI